MKFSIITVSLNSERTIKDTIESVVNQTYSNFEYILIDGNSQDKTLDIIKIYANKFRDKIKIVSEKDDGLYDAMNKGIDLAKGEIIGILNADDWYQPNALEIVNKAFQENPLSDIVTGEIKLYTYNRKFLRLIRNDRIEETILKKMPINHPATFVKRAVYREIGKFDTRYKISADYDFICRAYVNNKKFFQVKIALTNMRIGGMSSGVKDRGPKGLNNAILSTKENYLLIKRNTGKNFKMRYYIKIVNLYLRKIKRFFLKSRYGME